MTFGLKSAPATFQHALDIALSGVRRQACLIYLDDVIAFSKTVTEHITYVDAVLTLLWDARIALKLKKCFFY